MKTSWLLQSSPAQLSYPTFFDKETLSKSIDQLPEKLLFAIQTLSGTLDLDLKLNRLAKDSSQLKNEFAGESDQKNKIKQRLIDLVSNRFVADGYLPLAGSVAKGLEMPNLTREMSEENKASLLQRAEAVGLKVSGMIPGQRMLDMIVEQERIVKARMSSSESTTTSSDVEKKYEAARKESIVQYMLKKLESSSEEDLLEARKMAVVAHMVNEFADPKKMGSIGKYNVLRLTLKVIGDDITFYVLQDPVDDSYVLAHAVLGEFFFDSPRYDLIREKNLNNNELSLKDLEEIMIPQNIHKSSALVKFLMDMNLSQTFEKQFGGNIFRFLSQSEEFLEKGLSAFSEESLLEKTKGAHTISPVSIGGTKIGEGVTIGRAVLNTEDRTDDDFVDGILIDNMTEPKDDERMRIASGLVVTTGSSNSHTAVRAAQYGKPALIISSANYTEKGLEFETETGEFERMEGEFKGESVVYHELSGHDKESIVVEDGDLIYLDCDNRTFYVLAKSSEEDTVALGEEYNKWKNALPKAENLNESHINGLSDILKRIKDKGLIKAIINDLIGQQIISAEELESILGELLKEIPELRGTLVDFLRSQAEDAIEDFKRDYREYEKSLDETNYIEQVYLMVDDMIIKANKLKHMIQLANGNWDSELTIDKLDEAVGAIIGNARAWVKNEQQRLIEHVRKITDAEDEYSIPKIMRIRSQLSLVGLSLEDVDTNLRDRLESLISERLDEIEGLKGRGIVWKKDMADRLSRAIIGGKSAHSGELYYAIKILEAAGLIPEGMVVVPEGFAIQATEYEIHKDGDGFKEMDDELKKTIYLGYRDLVVEQAQDILELIDTEQRDIEDEELRKINGDIKKDLREHIFNDLKKIRELDDIELLDMLIDNHMYDIKSILKDKPKGAMSRSLRNRLQVYGAVAVRSSGLEEDSEEDAGAGLRSTVLNARKSQELFDAVREVWKSGAEAVLVEQMINAKTSVVAFSVDHRTKRADHIYITAAYRLAEGLVSGKIVDSDYYVFDKNPEGEQQYPLATVWNPVTGREEENPHIGKKEEEFLLNWDNKPDKDPVYMDTREPSEELALDNEEQARLVAQVVDALSQYFGFQVDMEASFDSDDRLVVLQARPVTALRKAVERGIDILLRSDKSGIDSSDLTKDGDAAMIDEVGGIDFNPDSLRLEIKGERIQFDISDEAIRMQNIQIDGLTPMIIQVIPITNLPLLLGVKEEEDKIDQLSMR